MLVMAGPFVRFSGLGVDLLGCHHARGKHCLVTVPALSVALSVQPRPLHVWATPAQRTPATLVPHGPPKKGTQMNTKRTVLLFAGLITAFVSMAAVAAGDDATRGRAPDPAAAGGASAPARPGPVVIADARGDVTPPKLDIQEVRVVNKSDKLKVRVYFPGVDTTYDFPMGAVSVFLDTDPSRAGAEYGHFMDFWSDYRFAEVSRWREQPTAAWGHSPEGACVATAGVQSDKRSRLRWFEYVVTRSSGCFEAGAVRVAVTTINTGDLNPSIQYARPAYDHLTAKHAWTGWIPVQG